MTVIGSNVSALRAANASNKANMSLSTAMERLSTGKVLTAEGQSKVATGRRYQDIVQQVSGVTGGSTDAARSFVLRTTLL